jgi:eukaryotic-like serine/threonine-protein kinase
MSTSRVVVVSIITSCITSVMTLLIFRGNANQLFIEEVQTPSVVGLRLDQARMLLEPRGLLLLQTEEREDKRIEPGHILSQTPLEGMHIKKGGEVRVILSKARDRWRVPDLHATPLTAAMKQLTAAGLGVGAVTRQKDDQVAADHVIATIPASETEVERNTSVNLVVSAGKQEGKVPNLLGKWPHQATQELEKAGFLLGKTTVGYNEDRRGGIVIRQDPPAESSAPVGSVVNIVVNESD